MVVGMIATLFSLSMAGEKSGGSDRFFCGSAPPGWIPPGQKRRPDRPDDLACHLAIREPRKRAD
jgi:hypothetical protein